ncbi:YbhB/YbcL family Raf kinase inhibitor-like protein [Oryzifoliimicrobium ureilyticus]|uniref:YbhB/YbcL family Raf kinase inhibitor-like protein n=1 Tax=Oryzifoliimicrobium ureilyticus TaxID=3113724 RepID=UPI0030765185
MHHFLRTIMMAGVAAFATIAVGAQAASLKVEIDGVDQAGRLPNKAAFCPASSAGQKNVSPGIAWSPGPRGTKSYVLLMTDRDVPQDFSQINKPDVVIRRADPRISVYHWVLVDIPPGIRSLEEGVDSRDLTPHGKPVGETKYGRRGSNIYASFFASSAEMAGPYGGYDGPCPPTNDERRHRYVVEVFALDTASLGLSGTFDGAAARDAMKGHVLSQGMATATYALNPNAQDAPVQ